MPPCLVDHDDQLTTLPVFATTIAELDKTLDALSAAEKGFVHSTGFRGGAGEISILPSNTGALAGIVLGLGDAPDPSVFGVLAYRAPQGRWRIERFGGCDPSEAALAWVKGAYAFDRYRSAPRAPAQLVWPEDANRREVERLADATSLVRDLVNTPTSDMGPLELETSARLLADRNGADIHVTTGDDLIDKNFPLIHAVGRAAAQAPRLIEMEWGDPSHPRVAIVGKGVCYDTGGLNIKPGDAMRLMKKDMGGAAHALGLAQLVMDAKLPCRLHVLVPAVENAISGNAFRQGDVLPSRLGLTVEVGHTDAEGRLVLADALAKACEDSPGLIIDFATLTGAARVALGPDIAPFYSNDEHVAGQITQAAMDAREAIWRMPLFGGYRDVIQSPIADIQNVGDGIFAGSIAAALFLERFVSQIPWLHFDIYAWRPKPAFDGPKGGEAQALRSAYTLLTKRLQAG